MQLVAGEEIIILSCHESLNHALKKLLCKSDEVLKMN